VPDVLADLLRRRVSTLTTEGRHALLVVSCVSEPTAALVETVAGEGGAEGLAEAFREGLLREDGGLLRLRQALVGSVLYADADAGTRRSLHRRIAEVIEDPLDRAMHLALSVEGWDEAVAAEVEAAARATRRRGAPSAAADLCDQARRLTPPHMAEDATRRALLAAEYSLDAGELPRSRALLEGILESPGSGPARAAALQRLGWVRSHQDSWGSASELFREAASEAEQAPALLATVELDRAVASLVGGNLPAAAAHAGAALERSKEVGDAALVAGSSAMVASVGFLLGRGIDEEVLQRAVAAETWSRPRPTATRPSVAFGVLLKWSDQLDQSRELLEQGLGLAEEHGAERSLPFILFHLSEVDCWLGDFPAAERRARRAIDVAEATGQDAGRAFGLSGLAAVQAALGREQEARAAATEGLALASSSGAVPAAVTCESTLGFLELSLGRPDRALRHLGPLVEGVVSGGVHEPGAMRYLGDALEALVSVGDLDTAEGVIEDLERRSDELDRAWGSMVAARCRALLLAARGDLPGATASAEAAVGFQERLSQPFELARTLLVQGAIERRDRRKRAGRELLERALETFSELGADLWVGRVREELARIGGRAASSVSLTPTEVRIARLVVDGAKNNEVAASMFLSIRTVEWNLSRIYRKLGIRSRTELARWIGPGPASSR
jgi:DNA-binding CsgD family transcriptional regulator